MKLIFLLSHGMAVLDGNSWPKNLVASLAILQNTEGQIKKKFLKLVKRQAKHWPKTIGRIVQIKPILGPNFAAADLFPRACTLKFET